MAKATQFKLKKPELEALRANALDIAGVGIVCFTMEGELVYSNERACEILELGPEYNSASDLAGHNLRDLIEFEEPEGSLRQRVKHSGRIQHGEYSFRTKSGKLKWVQHSSALAQHAATDTEYVQAVFVDITDQKLSEQDLRDSEVRYRELILQSAVPVAVSQDATTVFVNPAMCQLLGYQVEELLGQPYIKHIHPEEHEMLKRRAEGRLAGEPQPSRYELRLQHKDGRTLWVEVAVSMCTFDARPAIQTSYLDITQRKLAETELAAKAELQLAVQQQQAILNNIPDIAWLKDRECRFVAVNESFAEACGVPVHELIGKTDFDIWPAELAEAYRRDDQKVMQRCQRVRVEEPLVGPDGQQRWIETVKTPIVDEQGEVLGTTGIARDISERRLYDEAQRAVQEELEQRVNDRTIELLDANGALQEEIRERKAAQEALAQREQQMRILLDSLPGFAFFKDTTSRYILCNRLLAESHSTAVQEIIGKTDYDLFPAEQAEKFRADDALVISSGQPLLGIQELVLFKDQQVTLATHKVPVTDAQGKVTGLVGLAFDISERVAAEQRLRETELRLASMMASLPDVVLYETGGGREFVTENIVKLTGIPAAEFVGDRETFPRLMHPEDNQPMAQRIRDWRAAGEPGVLRLEFRCRRPDGRYGWLEDRMVCVGVGNGRPQYAGVLIDITERKHIEFSREIMLRIAEASSGDAELPDLLATVHRELGSLLDVSNFYVALYDAATQLYSFPYYVDSRDLDFKPQPLAGSKTDYVRATGRPLLISSTDQGVPAGIGADFQTSGPLATSWLGVPLRGASGAIGVIVVQSYDAELHYTQQDLQLLSLVTDYVAASIERQRSEARVRASRERLQRLADGVPVLIAHFDTELRCQFANRQYADWFNLSSMQIIGMPLSQILPPPALAAARPYFERVARGETVNYEAPAFGGSGGRYTQISVTPDQDAGGKVKGYHVIVTDITELKQAQEELRLNEVRLEALLELSRMTESSVKDITAYALEKAVELTQSRLGYLAFTRENETILEMYSWSKAAMEECAVENLTYTYPVATTGLWGEAVRQRQAVITNDYLTPSELKKGYPEGHVTIQRHMNLPLFEGEQIILVAGVGNKDSDYNESDVHQLTLLMDGMWKILQRKRAEEATRDAMFKLEAANLQLEAEVAERRRIQEELKRSEDRYRRLVETAQEGILTDDADGLITFVNPFLAHALGYDPGQLLGRTIADLCEASSARLVEREGEQRRQGFISSYEIRMLHQNGGLKDFLLTANPLYDEQGVYEGALGIFTDMTESKRAEAALRTSEERYRYLVENISDGIGVTDLEENFTFANPALEKIFGVDPGQLAGSNLHFFVEPDDFRMIRGHSALRSEGLSSQYEHYLLRPDGSRRYVSVHGSPLTSSDGTLHGAFAVVRDITAQRAAERLLRVQRDLGLALGAARDLREILRIGLTAAIEAAEQDSGGIFLTDEEAGQFILVEHSGVSEEFLQHMRSIPVDAPNVQMVLTGGSYFGEFSQMPGADPAVDFEGLGAMGIVPIRHEGKVIGALVVSSHTDVGIAPAAVGALEALAGQIGMALARARVAEALAENERFLQAVFDGIQNGISVLDTEQRIVRVNRTMEQWYAHAAPLVGRYCYEVYHGRSSPCETCPSIRALQTCSPQIDEVPLIGATGPIGHLELHSFPLLDKDGQPAGVIEYVADITERQKAARELQYERDLLHSLMDSIPDTVYFKNTSGHFTRINRAQAQLLGLPSPQDALGLTDADFCSPSQAAEKAADELAIMQTGRPLIGKVERIVAADGRLLWMSTTKLPHRDADNHTLGTFGISRDISEIIEAREALRESEERYRMLVDTMDEGIVLLDLHGICHYANPAVYAVLQTPPGSLIGEDIRRYVNPDQLPQLEHELGRRADGLRGSYELQIMRTDGEYRDVWVTATPRFDATGQAVGSLSVLQDITERKLLLNQLVQEQKEETILTLAGGIAHDFNNILVGVLGSATLLMETADLSGSEVELCEMIRTSAQRMSDLTSKLLAYARGGRYQPRPLDVNTAVNETLTILRSSIPAQIELVREQAHDLWMIEGDAGQIHQVLLNLIINAYEAMPSGGRLLIRTENAARPRGWRCARHASHPPGDYIQLTVADTGHGIDSEILERIFEPFYSTKLQGRGLGLAAVQGIIRNHNGCIQVESAPGQGAVFTILLPRAQLLRELGPASSSTSSGSRELLLFVDDEQVVREMARRALERRGYRVLLAGTGQEGLDVYQAYAEEIKLVIFDMQMPEMGGAEMFTQLKQLNPQLKSIASSGFNATLALNEITGDSPTGFIQKPYAPRELMDLIQQILEQA